MPLYAIDVCERVIRRVARDYDVASNTRYSLIEADSVKQAWSKAVRSSTAPASTGALNLRVRKLL